jgi:hypothetical protein
MTRAGITVTGREVAAITGIGAVLAFGFWMGVVATEVRSDLRGVKRDICEYSVPETKRQFAYSCQDSPSSGLAAQSTR